MLLSRHKSRSELLELRLPAAVIAIFDGKSPHQILSYRCQIPNGIFIAGESPTGHHITPLWECGVVLTAYEHRLPHGRFIRFSFESHKEIKVFGRSFRSVAADMLIDLWEDGDSKNDLREVARLFEFLKIDELLRECEGSTHFESVDDYYAWRARLLTYFDTSI